MKKEIQNLTELDHPHILKLYEVYSSPETIYLVTDFCSGGELAEAVKATKEAHRLIPEHWIADATMQLMKAVSHIHARGIIHLDLKAQNIMLMPNQKTKMYFQKNSQEAVTAQSFAEKPHLMVIDLGVAMHFKPGNFRGNRPMGTPMTMAPDVWMGDLTPFADVFSCGCVFFQLLCNEMPFGVPSVEHGFDDIVNYWKRRPSPSWQKVKHRNAEALALLRSMLQQDRQQRISSTQCLTSPFLQGAKDEGSLSVANSIPATARSQLLRRLSTVHRRSILYKNIALTIAQDWPPNQMPSIKQLFSEFDVIGYGSLPTHTLAKTLISLGIDKNEAQLAATAMNLSQDNDSVEWTEFRAACIDLSQPEFEERIFKAFQSADEDKDNLLSARDLGQMFAQGHKYFEEVIGTVFLELTGRDPKTNSGARLDWSTFYSHLKKCARDGMEESEQGTETTKEFDSKAQWGVFAGMVDAVNSMFSSSERVPVKTVEPTRFPGEQQPKTMSEMLKVLEDMGLKDRKMNEKVIRSKGGQLTDEVIEMIMLRSQ
eukprot:TRINITY_DN25006_c0_g2_i1.p1 TRINITY_DN25006_c0_g2~~TRINITY_DN25006_c0_g2_i1.p1  ORF type:complete len:541 (+),score=109.48 TRINITY_DN25006_c0_g2_i1:170-1792(+)